MTLLVLSFGTKWTKAVLGRSKSLCHQLWSGVMIRTASRFPTTPADCSIEVLIGQQQVHVSRGGAVEIGLMDVVVDGLEILRSS